MFFKALAVAAVNIEITLGKKYPAFGKLTNGERRLQLSDALMTCAPSQRQNVGRGANIKTMIQKAKRSRQQNLVSHYGVADKQSVWCVVHTMLVACVSSVPVVCARDAMIRTW